MAETRLQEHAYVIPEDQENSESVSSDQSLEELSFEEEEKEEETPTWINTCSDKSFRCWKVSGALGAVTSTLTYCTTYAISGNPFIATLSTLVPIGFGLCAAKFTSQKDLKIGFGAYVISAGVTGTLNAIGGLFPLDAYPLLVPIVSLNVVACANLITPDLCLNLPKVRDKLSQLSNNCFSLWNRSSSKNNEETHLNEVVLHEKRNLSLR